MPFLLTFLMLVGLQRRKRRIERGILAFHFYVTAIINIIIIFTNIIIVVFTVIICSCLLYFSFSSLFSSYEKREEREKGKKSFSFLLMSTYHIFKAKKKMQKNEKDTE